MNDVLTFMLPKNKTYTINYVSGDNSMKSTTVTLKDKPEVLKLYMK